jgi:predicted metal-dependent phosphoesterase TrpH
MLVEMKGSLLATFALIAFHALPASAQLPASAPSPAPLNTTTISLNITGVYEPDTLFTFQCVPFDVPPGCTSITVVQIYDKPLGNSLDIGLWDQRGFELYDGRNYSTGFRGWSGGAKSNFTLSAANASTGYIPGSIEPGIWCVGQGPYVVIPEGIHWTVLITLGFDPVDEYYQSFPSDARIGSDPSPDGPKWRRGDMHIHTDYSDGGFTPADIVRFAQEANLEFMVSSEHNTNGANMFYGAIAPADLLVIKGIEVTTRNGHWQAIGIGENDWVEFRYHPGDVPGLDDAKRQVQKKRGGVVSINHPYIFVNCDRCNWTFPDWDFDAIEVWNGYWDETDQMAVDKWQELMVEGKMLCAMGGSDFHNPPVMVGTPTTIIKSDAQTENAVVDGIKRRRVIVVYGPAYDLTMCVRAGNNPCVEVGDQVVGEGKLQLELGTTGMNGSTASVWTEKGKIHELDVKERNETLTYDLPEGHKWVRVEVRNATNMLGLTNVVFLKP